MSFYKVGKDGVEARPMPIKEELAATLHPVLGAFRPAAEQGGRMAVQCRHGRIKNQSADVDADPIWSWLSLRPLSDDDR